MNSKIGYAVDILTKDANHRSVTYFHNEKQVIHVTRNNKPNKRDRYACYSLTLGAPNYLDRAYIKRLRRAGMDVHGAIKIRLWPKKKKEK